MDMRPAEIEFMRVFTVMAALFSMLCHGCGSSQTLPIAQPVPVRGKITYRGTPLTQGQVTLEATDGGRDAKGKIEPDGRFTLTMNQEGDGATIGVYRVVVSDTDPRVQTKKETHLRVTEGQAEYLIDLK
jgi:hypothetical protein